MLEEALMALAFVVQSGSQPDPSVTQAASVWLPCSQMASKQLMMGPVWRTRIVGMDGSREINDICAQAQTLNGWIGDQQHSHVERRIFVDQVRAF
jgi:hypothetical protein